MVTPSGILNPYASKLGAHDPLEVMRTTPNELTRLVDLLGLEGLARSLRPGSWNARQIVGHLAETEIAFAFRIRQSLAEDHHVIQPFDQDRWNDLHPDWNATEALRLFSIVRATNIALVEHLPSHVLEKPVTHPERGEMTFRHILETIGGHDINHLEQLEAIAGH